MIKEPQTWIELNGIDVILNEIHILKNCQWSLRENEHWGIVGPNGSGKSTFLRLIKGDLWPAPGHFDRRRYRINGSWQNSPIGVKENIGYVSPEQQAEYLRQEWLLSAYDVLATGFYDTPLLYSEINQSQKDQIQKVIEQLNLQNLLNRPLQNLSQGQARKILIARALLHNPELLILDEVCDGLDQPSREELIQLIENLSQNGIQIMYSSHRTEEFPITLTHELYLESGRIVHQQEFQTIAKNNDSTNKYEFQNYQQTNCHNNQQALIKIQNCNVWLDESKILDDINWCMYPNQHWAIVGPNGCGKSTFLRLLYAEHRPELGGSIHWFGQENKWHVSDLREKIGMVSNHLQATYTYNLTALETIISGFDNSIGLYEPGNTNQLHQAKEMMDQCDIKHLSDSPIRSLSHGELRKVLLARALINQPKLLLLDEPFNGLDQESRKQMKQLLNQFANNGIHLIMVTHHPDDLLPCITNVAQMDDGKIIETLATIPSLLQ